MLVTQPRQRAPWEAPSPTLGWECPAPNSVASTGLISLEAELPSIPACLAAEFWPDSATDTESLGLDLVKPSSHSVEAEKPRNWTWSRKTQVSTREACRASLWEHRAVSSGWPGRGGWQASPKVLMTKLGSSWIPRRKS